MSKIGRIPIDIGPVEIKIEGQKIYYKGSNAEGVYELPAELGVKLEDKKLLIFLRDKKADDINCIWGLHRALLANAIKGAAHKFEKQLKIVGLGYKVSLSGNKMIISLGYSHKITMELPKNVSLEIDKTGQLLTFKSANKELLGQVCDKIRSYRPPEPYKGTGVRYFGEEVARKAGKAKTAA